MRENIEQTRESSQKGKHIRVTTWFWKGDGGPKSLEYFTLETSESKLL